MQRVFSNDMTLHVWAQGRQSAGRSAKGAIYFEGPALFSYGWRYVMGLLISPGVALINGDTYSRTTSKHTWKAMRATRRGFSCPDLTGLYDSALAPVARLKTRLQQMQEAPNKLPDMQAQSVRTAEAELVQATNAARARVLAWAEGPACNKDQKARHGARNWPSFPRLNPEAVVLALQFCGVNEAEALKAAGRAIATRDKRAAAWAAEAEARKVAALLDQARASAAVPLATLQAELAQEARGQWFQAERAERHWRPRAVALFHAAKAAKAKGWTRMAAELAERRGLILGAIKRWHGAEAAIQGRRAAMYEGRKARLARATLDSWRGLPSAERGAYLARAIAAHGENKLRAAATQGAEAFQILAWIAEAEALGVMPDPESGAFAIASGNWNRAAVAAVQRAWRAMGRRFDAARAAELYKARLQAAGQILGALGAASARVKARQDVAAIRAFRALPPDATRDMRDSASGDVLAFFSSGLNIQTPERARQFVLSLPRCRALLRGADPAPLVALYAEAQAMKHAAQAEARAEKEALAAAWQAARVTAWRQGQPMPERPAALPSYHYPAPRLSDAAGGALIRAEDVKRDDSGAIVAGKLVTSWGAEAPLPHAVKALGLISATRDRGQAWESRGHGIKVGHFTVDQIKPDGGIVAGCHRINWPEIAELAGSLGLISPEPMPA